MKTKAIWASMIVLTATLADWIVWAKNIVWGNIA